MDKKDFKFNPYLVARTRSEMMQMERSYVMRARDVAESRMMSLTQEKRTLATLGTYNIIYVNDIVSNDIHNAINLLRKVCSKKKVLSLCDEIESARSRYENKIHSILDDFETSACYMDGCDKYDEMMRGYITNFYDTIEDGLVREGIDNAYEFSRLYGAKALTDLSVKLYDDRIDEMNREKANPYDNNLKYLRLAYLKKLMQKLCICFPRVSRIECDGAQAAFDAFQDRISDAQCITDAIHASDDTDYEELKKIINK